MIVVLLGAPMVLPLLMAHPLLAMKMLHLILV
jgi:hypothetical protein